MHIKFPLQKSIVTIVTLFLALSPIFIAGVQSIQITASSEYNQFVHTTINSEEGNITAIDKPIFPVMINNSQLQVGQNWIITCPLEANHKYHIYCYGTWTTSQIKTTDYDVYVYNPSGSIVSSHTEAAGVIEQVYSEGSNLFTPEQTGTYTFTIKNDARESQDAQQATFMIIENIECNQWYSIPIQGKTSDSFSTIETSRAYEFVTNASNMEIYITVPNTLDTYESRLFLMNDGSGPIINGYPLAVESWLYGNFSGVIGGYNFDTNGSRGVNYASCEHMGDDMFLTYSPTTTGPKLYHLALIGEEGQGEVEFMIKTDFTNITLSPSLQIGKVHPSAATEISYKTNSYTIEKANLTYSIDNWATSELIPMVISNQTCNATVPGQTAGTTVEYRVDAEDVLKNSLSTTGNYSVKVQPTLTIALAKETVTVGQNITVTGALNPSDENSIVNIQFFSANDTQIISCKVLSDGSFTGTFSPQTPGNWGVLANALETKTSWTCNSSQYMVTVKEPPFYVTYALYILIGLVVASAVGGVVYFLKFRRS
jgi:hypothetical protein